MSKRSVRAGDTLGRYELGEELGEGGMATVFRARDRELRRDVAVKVLFPHLAKRPEIVHRFQREARAAAALDHANILRIYDVGDVGDDDDTPPFIVMELVRGRTLLGEIEQRGPMFAEAAACVGVLLAEALAAAHQAGIIHRDVKPANVLIADASPAGRGRVLLADFGVARLETEDSLVTKTGAVLGTPAYMSPEQAGGDTATAKSDLYSLGATLYQLVTGSLPFTGSPAKVLAQIATGARVSAVDKRAEVGPDLSRVIDRLMASDPAARPASAKDVAVDLRAITAAAGFGEPADELAAYFEDPAAFARAKTPAVVSATVAAASRAIRDAKLPRAMALADRASALAPGDPAVVALVHMVTEGGRSSRRNRALAIGAAIAAVIGGVAFAGFELLVRGEPDHVRDATIAEMASNVPPAVPIDASTPDAAVEQTATPLSDAAVAHVTHDARVREVVDAAVGSSIVPTDAPDAPVAPVAPIDAPVVAVPGGILVVNDTWCDVTIDHIARGRAGARPFDVDPGHHELACAQPGTGREWTREVDVTAGNTVTATGAMLGTVAVTFEIDGKLDREAFGRGRTTMVKIGRHSLEADDVKKYVDVRSPCVVRSQPELDCYPNVH